MFYFQIHNGWWPGYVVVVCICLSLPGGSLRGGAHAGLKCYHHVFGFRFTSALLSSSTILIMELAGFFPAHPLLLGIFYCMLYAPFYLSQGLFGRCIIGFPLKYCRICSGCHFCIHFWSCFSFTGSMDALALRMALHCFLLGFAMYCGLFPL